MIWLLLGAVAGAMGSSAKDFLPYFKQQFEVHSDYLEAAYTEKQGLHTMTKRQVEIGDAVVSIPCS
jgi:hypothetical protein